MKTKLFILFFLLNSLAYASNQDIYQFKSPTDSTRFQFLTQQIRCVVCQGQNISDSNAPLAKDLREKVYKMVSNNQSNEEIENYLVKRYGEFILLKPRFNKLTILLWTFPFIGIFLIFYFIFRTSQTK